MAINLIDRTETFYVKSLYIRGETKNLVKPIETDKKIFLTIDQLPPYGGDYRLKRCREV